MDLGVKHLAALSTGEVIDNGRPGARQAARLTRLQRAYARTQPGSNRRERVRRQIAALQHGIALRRAGLLHQVSTRLATDFAVVALEDLNVAGMTRSARGTLEAPGRNVAAKSGLNRAILDAGLGMLRRQLDYKTSWAGSQVKMIDRFAPSSKACSRCGTVKSTLSLAERTFECEACHLVIDRDVNAAINIRAWAVQEERGAGVELARGRRESRNGRGAAVSGPPSGGAAGQGRGSVKPAPQGVGMSSRATGWSSQPPSTEGESAERSFGMATSTVPTRVSRSRCRYPLRWADRVGVGLPHSAPTTASASAESRVLIMVCSKWRIMSGDASDRASLSRPAGSRI